MRFQWLDFFRGGAAIVVVLFHFSGYFGLPRLQFGYLAVDLFFVLSGIVLGRKYHLAIRAGMPFRQFAWHRMRRLYPVAVITACLLVGIDLLGVAAPGPRSTPATVLSVLFIIPYGAGHGYWDSFPDDLPEWSLWAELAANVVWFAVLRFGSRAASWLCALSMIGFLWLALERGGFDVGASAGLGPLCEALLRALAWFGVGYLIALKRPRLPGPVSPWIFLLATMCALRQFERIDHAVADFLVVSSGTLLLISLMQQRPSGGVWPRICHWMGALSFPLYMTHLPSGRLAGWAASSRGLGLSPGWAYFIIPMSVALIAMGLNEWIVHRLPREPAALRSTLQRLLRSR